MSEFFQAALPEPHTVLGLRLRPFSPGCIYLLSFLENNFVATPDADTGLRPATGADDLFTGVWLCSEQFSPDYERARAWLQRLPEWRDAMAEWVRQYQQKFGAINFQKKCQAFARYIDAGSRGPRHRAIESGTMSQPLTLMLPLVQIVKVDLLKNRLCASEAEFMDRPWSACLWDWFTLKGLSGKCEIFDESKIDDAYEFAKNLWHELNAAEKPRNTKRKTRNKKRGRRVR